MEYTIKEVAEKTGFSIYTLRYYDKEGLLPNVKRSESGVRKFTEKDIEWINLICCLKNSGMPVEKIKEFMILCLQGEKTVEERKELLLEHRKAILEKMEHLKTGLEIIDYKIEHYKEIGIFHIDS